MTVWQLIAAHPDAFGFALTLLGGLGVAWLVQRPEWDKDG